MGYTVGSNTELLGTSPDIVAQLSEVASASWEINLLILNSSTGARACKYKGVLRHTDIEDLLGVCHRHASRPDSSSSSRRPGILRHRAVCMSKLAPGNKVYKKTVPPMFLFQVAAHCSGLFSSVRVRNVTSVCYPATRHAGALAVYHPKQVGHQKPAYCV